MQKYSDVKSSIVLSVLAAVLIGGLISNGFALMPQIVHTKLSEVGHS